MYTYIKHLRVHNMKYKVVRCFCAAGFRTCVGRRASSKRKTWSCISAMPCSRHTAPRTWRWSITCYQVIKVIIDIACKTVDWLLNEYGWFHHLALPFSDFFFQLPVRVTIYRGLLTARWPRSFAWKKATASTATQNQRGSSFRFHYSSFLMTYLS